MAKASGKSLNISYVTYSNEKLKNWCNPKNKNGKRAYRAISGKKWDYIILQEQTDSAIAHGGSFVDSSKKLAACIRAQCPGAEIIYNCMWAYNKTKKLSGVSYGRETQQRLMSQTTPGWRLQPEGRYAGPGTRLRSTGRQRVQRACTRRIRTMVPDTDGT